MRVPEYTLSEVRELESACGPRRPKRDSAAYTNWGSLRKHACRKHERRCTRSGDRIIHSLHLPVAEGHPRVVQCCVRLVRVLEQHGGRGTLCRRAKLDDSRLPADGVGRAGEDQRSLPCVSAGEREALEGSTNGNASGDAQPICVVVGVERI